MSKIADKETGEVTGLALLRIPFSENQISILPKPYKKDSPKGTCSECGGYHGLPAVHLSYVGHAALTDRLLNADPGWSWEPLAMGEDGLPRLDSEGGMWIKLTVCGVTRLGYGDAQGKAGGNAVKERIGDALRNAAMRFGAALDLWHKGDLHATREEDDEDEDAGKKLAKKIAAAKVTPIAGVKDNLTPDERKRVDGIASKCLDWLNADTPSVPDAAAIADEAEMSPEEALYFWTHFTAPQRSAMKLEGAARRKRALVALEATQA